MEIIISNSSNIPIYEQIKEEVKSRIVSGELEEGMLLPSIRSLSKDLRCSVITTKNAYEELEKEGYVKTIPSKGVYVNKINRELAREEQLKKLEKLMENAINIAKINNISKKEIKDLVNVLYEEE